MFDPPNKSITYQTLKVKRNVLTDYKMYDIIFVEGFMFKVTTFPVKLVEGMEKATCGQRNVRGKVLEFNTLLELATHASEWTISPVVLKNAYRKNENFESSSLIMVDVDDHMDLDECLAMLDMKQVEFALYTSFSHSEAKDKFHIILPLDREVTEECDYKATHDYVSKNFFSRVNDNATSSASNLFYNGNPKTVRIETSQEGKELGRIPVQKGKPSVILTPSVVGKPPLSEMEKIDKLSKRTLKFLNAGAEDKKWHDEFKLVVPNMKSAGYTKEEAINKLLTVTGKLTENDMYQIEYAYRKDNKWNYNLEVLGKDTHPLRLRYIDPTNGKKLNIPAREIVDAYIQDRNVKITAGGNIKSGENETDLGILKEYIRDFAETELDTKLNLSVIESVISSFREKQRLIQLDQLKERIKFTNASFNYEEWCEALIGKVDKITIAIMKHFIWQIKRKLADKEVKYPIMPVFYGKSGAGKSYHLRHHILKPIKDIVYFDGDFRKLVDSREAYNLASHYVYFLDEMSKAEHADVETIKNKITSDTIQYRKLGTNETVRASNKVTFVGTSNLPLNSVIKDPTSVRRFFEVKITEKMNFDKISALDYQAMWQSIDESVNEDPFFIENQEEITAIQETFRHKSVIEEYLLENEYSNDKDLPGEKVPRKEIYHHFKVWIGDSGYRHPINKHAFAQSLKDKLGEALRFKKDNIVHNGYIKIKTNHDE
jgi:molybdopterin-guanine dinucleotide biosynthesis protein